MSSPHAAICEQPIEGLGPAALYLEQLLRDRYRELGRGGDVEVSVMFVYRAIRRHRDPLPSWLHFNGRRRFSPAALREWALRQAP